MAERIPRELIQVLAAHERLAEVEREFEDARADLIDAIESAQQAHSIAAVARTLGVGRQRVQLLLDR